MGKVGDQFCLYLFIWKTLPVLQVIVSLTCLQCIFCFVAGFIHGIHSLQFTVQPSGADVEEGASINLLCEVDESNVQIEWTLDGQPVDVTDGRRSLEENTLRILEVHKNNDAGEFRCVATKGSEAITSDPASLNIICKYASMEERNSSYYWGYRCCNC